MGTNVGEKIKELRKSKEITQESLAGTLGITRQALSKWENGSTEPNATQIPRLCEVFQITPSQLLGINFESETEIAQSNILVKEQKKEFIEYLTEFNNKEEKAKSLLIRRFMIGGLMVLASIIDEIGMFLSLGLLCYVFYKKESSWLIVACMTIVFYTYNTFTALFFPNYSLHFIWIIMNHSRMLLVGY